MFQKKDLVISLVLFLYAGFVIFSAGILGIGKSFELGDSKEELLGYWSSHWVYLYFWVIPIAYLLSVKHKNSIKSKIDELCKARVISIDYRYREDVESFFLPAFVPVVALCLALMLNVLDYTTVMAQQLKTYTVEDIAAARAARKAGSQIPVGAVHEPDWSIFSQFPETGVSLRRNSFFNLMAYSQQFLVSFFGILLFVRSIAFNLAFLRSVWLRNKISRRSFHIQLNINDGDGKLGFGALGSYFNANLALLVVAGLICLASRFGNVDNSEVLSFLKNKTVSDPEGIIRIYALPVQLVPDIGQAILIFCWTVIFAGMLLPGLTKFLPLLYYSGDPLRGADNYLRELFPDAQLGRASAKEDVERNCQKFRDQSFWPSGTGQASLCVIFASIVQVWMFVPISPTGLDVLGKLWLFVIIPGVALGSIILACACMALWFVDTKLSSCLQLGKKNE